MFRHETRENFESIRRTYESAGIRMAAFHLPNSIDDDIASLYESVRTKAVLNTRKWMENPNTLGADTGILHPTTNRLDASMEGTEGYISQLDKSLGELLPATESISFTLAIENMLLVSGLIPGSGLSLNI